MTPQQFIRTECCNYSEDGCIVRDNKPCLVCATLMRRCGYAEQSVLPIADQPSPHANPKLQKQRLEARAIYFATLGGGTQVTPDVRTCACGNPLAARKRLCEKCASDNRRKAMRNQMNRQRSKLREGQLYS